jgi:cell division protein FtsB
VSRGRVIGALVFLGGLAFGFFGGEYSTLDWWTLKREIGSQQAALNRLYVELDSLGQAADLLENYRAAQERAARELFGMIRDGEVLYRVEFEAR